MTAAEIEAAKAWAASGRIEWRAGMRVLLGSEDEDGPARCIGLATSRADREAFVVFAVEGKIDIGRGPHGPCVGAWSEDAIDGEEVIDLADPATKGVLLGMVREAWSCPFAYVAPYQHSALPGGVKWIFMLGSRQPGIEGATEGLALLAALVAAPVRT